MKRPRRKGKNSGKNKRLITPKVISIPLATPYKLFPSLWASPCWICREGLSLMPRQGWLIINSSSLETVAMACKRCLPGTTSTILFVFRCSYRNRRFYTLVNKALSHPGMFWFFFFSKYSALPFQLQKACPVISELLFNLSKRGEWFPVQRDRTGWQQLRWLFPALICPSQPASIQPLQDRDVSSCMGPPAPGTVIIGVMCVRSWLRGNRL